MMAAGAVAARADNSVSAAHDGAAKPEAATPEAAAEVLLDDAPNLTHCGWLLTRARQELLDRGFNPAVDTGAALQVHENDDGTWELSAHVAAAADSLHESFELTITKAPTRGPTTWKKSSRPICCDDFAESEDHVVQVTSVRRRRGLVAAVVTTTGRYPERPRWVRLFTEIASRAADACLEEDLRRHRPKKFVR